MTRTCAPTNLPGADSIDVPALREKYLKERAARLIKEATDQYARTEGGEFSDVYESDPHTPVQDRSPISEDLDVAILGAGWTGLLAAYHLKRNGITDFRNIDHAGGWGGVWYWNRYPGLQCDNDAYCYLPLLEEMDFLPSKKFTDGYEIREYMNSIVERFELGPKAIFHTLARSLRWDEGIRRWHITTDRGDDIRARFVVMGNGLLNIPKLPGVPGLSSFKGKIFHTSRWEYDYTGGDQRSPSLTGLRDKTVAIVGTGASAVQAIPFLAEYAKQLYVVQRTPSTVDERENPPTDPAWVRTLTPGWQRRRQQNFDQAAISGLAPGQHDLVCDIWTEINRNLAAELESEGWPALSIEEFMKRREIIDYRVMERLRNLVDATVESEAAREALKPWYRFLCKRPLSSNDFYPVFNRPNVELIDVSRTRGLERVTERGFVAAGREYAADCLIFGSGFEVTSSLERRWGLEAVEGRGGASLYDHWRNGYKTLHGITTRGFPSLFFTGFIQSAFNATTTEMLNGHCAHIGYVIAEALSRGAVAVEPTAEAQQAWVDHVRETAFDNSQYLNECTPSFFNGEGTNRKTNFYLGDNYGPGWYPFEEILADWRAKGDMAGLLLESAPAAGADVANPIA